MIFRYFRLFMLSPILLVVSLAAFAQDAVTFEKLLRSWERTIEKVESRVQSGHTGSLEERDLRDQLQEIVQSAVVERDAAVKQVAQTQGLLKALGPQPTGEEAKPETPTIQTRRKNLVDALVSQDGKAKQAELIIAKADQVIARIGGRSRERLKAALVERTVTPLRYNTWAIAVPEAVRIFDASFIEASRAWWDRVRSNPDKQTSVLTSLFIALGAAFISWPLSRWLRAHYGRVPEIDSPGYARRLLAGLVEGGGRSLAPIILVLVAGALIINGGLVEGPLITAVQALVRNLVLFFFGYALINASLAARNHQWRLLDFEAESSRLLVFRLKLTLGAFLFFEGARQAVSWTTLSAEMESVLTLLFTLVLTPLLISLLSSKIWGQFSSDEKAAAGPVTSRYQRLRVFLIISLIALPILSIIGFPGLATYLTRAVVMSGLFLGGIGLLRSIGRETLAASLDSNRPLGRNILDVLALKRGSSQQVLFWLRFLLDIGLLLFAAMVLLPVWGLGAGDTATSAAKFMGGIQIGSYTFSLSDILIGLLLFTIIIFLTRLAQKGLDRHILPNLTKDKGVQDALKTGFGYIGSIIAVLVTVSVLGLDLTNLALIAGALSVGIGFGLQNVVNNFVSGLILLAERPIKPGDWVVVGGHEGTVKKVNVRSTEIETFQRASVIMPNADLISNPVINWTHKNMTGRVEIVVGVAYGTDPHLVQSVLLDCARTHPNVLANPEPFVLFIDFGESSLNFELRAYLANVEKRLHTASEIRFAIHFALKEKGIEIPFPQRVLHFTSPAPGVPSAGDEKV